MRALYTFGCSLTRYHWPTWADLLGFHFDYHENWAASGLGNRAIVERLSECVVRSKITADDVIIVQWTDFHRHDTHSTKRESVGWSQHGSIFNNQDYSKEWIEQVWDEQSYMMHTYNFINLGVALLKTLPCEWYMTSINDLIKPMNSFPQLSPYRQMFESKNWLPHMGPFWLDSPYERMVFKNEDYYQQTGKLEDYIDPHPSPKAHLDYMSTYLAPKWGFTPDEEWVNAVHNTVKATKFHSEIEPILLDKADWAPESTVVRGL